MTLQRSLTPSRWMGYLTIASSSLRYKLDRILQLILEICKFSRLLKPLKIFMLKQDTNYLDYCRTFHHKHISFSILIPSWTLTKSMRKFQDVLHQLITLKLGLLSTKTFISGLVHAKIHFWQICLLTQLWNSQLIRLWAWFTRQIWPQLTFN